ncbi:hypothetical protein NUW58_g8672 [Xylaria curta]|uniref:Uncharacterized protein n=1 Tax=Xylaria curta TaxID=42375 RepID=A0ACC1N7F8_9PEZI|nr:hypothetical protein NUW58_g8672 [Xylaria curta]
MIRVSLRIETVAERPNAPNPFQKHVLRRSVPACFFKGVPLPASEPHLQTTCWGRAAKGITLLYQADGSEGRRNVGNGLRITERKPDIGFIASQSIVTSFEIPPPVGSAYILVFVLMIFLVIFLGLTRDLRFSMLSTVYFGGRRLPYGFKFI